MQGNQPSSTPGSLPAATPQSYGMVDHSFTLQTVMELQKNVGALTSQVQHLAGVIEKLEGTVSGNTEKLDQRLGGLEGDVRAVHTKVSLTGRVGLILAGLLSLAVGAAWAVSQDAIKDVAKTAIGQAISAAVQQHQPGAAAPAPQSSK